MDAKRRELRRIQLDRQFALSSSLPIPPQGGWIRAIRESLGMSLESLGRRLGASRQAAHSLEKAEAKGSVTLNLMRSAADALGCDLVVMMVPRRPLDETVREKALEIARQEVLRAGHTMVLEKQGVSSEWIERTIAEVADDLVKRGDPRIWD